MGFQTNLLLPRILGGETGKPSVRTWTREKMPSEHEGELINEGEWMDVGGEIGRSLDAVKTLITSRWPISSSLPKPIYICMESEEVVLYVDVEQSPAKSLARQTGIRSVIQLSTKARWGKTIHNHLPRTKCLL